MCEYGNFFEKESEKYGFNTLNMDDDFDNQIQKAIYTLTTDFFSSSSLG